MLGHIGVSGHCAMLASYFSERFVFEVSPYRARKPTTRARNVSFNVDITAVSVFDLCGCQS